MERKKKEAEENYLRIIYELDEDKGVKSVEIARKLSVSKASVSEMLRKLAIQGLLNIKPYSKIFLTKKGRKEAEKLFDKHFAIKRFIKKIFRYNDEKAIEESHKLEHALSHESVGIMDKILEGKSLEEKPEEILKVIPSYIG